MANIDYSRKALAADPTLQFLKDYPQNFGFIVYSTWTGNRISIEILYIPDTELKLHGSYQPKKPTGYEIAIGQVHVVLANEKRPNIKSKVDKIINTAPIFEKVARKYGYPDGVFSPILINGQQQNLKNAINAMRNEMKEAQKTGIVKEPLQLYPSGVPFGYKSQNQNP